MEPLKLDIFNGRMLQSFMSLLTQLERTGVTEIRYARQQVEKAFERQRYEANKGKRSKAFKQQQADFQKRVDEVGYEAASAENMPERRKNNVMQKAEKVTHVLCPLCNGAYLKTRKILDPVDGSEFVDTYCSHCRTSREFK